MTSEKPEASLREKVARTICSEASGRFCDCIGEFQGCKVGRGEQFDGTNCAASLRQLELSWEWGIAGKVLAIPEIAEALELMDEESPVHVSPEERDRLQREKNRQLRSLVDQVKSP